MNEARETLMELLKDGKYTVYTKVNHVSRSGMSRSISMYVADESGSIREITGLVCGLQNKRRDRYDGITIGGCGMDMGFALVYDLSGALWPNGYGCIGPDCPANDHSNGDRDYTPDGGEDPEIVDDDKRHWHNDGGYRLHHRWL